MVQHEAVKFSETSYMISKTTAVISVAILVASVFLLFFFELPTVSYAFIVVGHVPMMFLVIYLYYSKMELAVGDSELRIKTWRFSRTVPLRSIVGCRLTDISPMRDFEGYGIRLGRGCIGYVYPRTSKGVRFSYPGEEREIVISSKRSDELLRALCDRREGR